MSALTCDICGGKLIMQTGALVKCESCGMEYNKERMQEKVQAVLQPSGWVWPSRLEHGWCGGGYSFQ